jgi:hypothetical protein
MAGSAWGEVPLVDEPAAAGAEGRGGEAVLLEKRAKGRAVDRCGRRSEDFERVEAELGGGRGRGGFESVPIDERTRLGLGDEGDRRSRT